MTIASKQVKIWISPHPTNCRWIVEVCLVYTLANLRGLGDLESDTEWVRLESLCIRFKVTLIQSNSLYQIQGQSDTEWVSQWKRNCSTPTWFWISSSCSPCFPLSFQFSSSLMPDSIVRPSRNSSFTVSMSRIAFNLESNSLRTFFSVPAKLVCNQRSNRTHKVRSPVWNTNLCDQTHTTHATDSSVIQSTFDNTPCSQDKFPRLSSHR